MLNPRTDDGQLRHYGSPNGGLGAPQVASADGSGLDPVSAGVRRQTPGWLWELVGYGFVSAVALLADAVILRFLVQTARWHYVPASALAFTTGAAVAYSLSIRFVFRTHRVANRLVEFTYFLGLGVAGLVVNTLIISLAFGLLGIGLITSKLLAACGTFLTNFVLRRWFLFSGSEGSR
jgi:putative flippase GtrA